MSKNTTFATSLHNVMFNKNKNRNRFKKKISIYI